MPSAPQRPASRARNEREADEQQREPPRLTLKREVHRDELRGALIELVANLRRRVAASLGQLRGVFVGDGLEVEPGG
ncbi:hypothetical protein MB84_29760 (plasmid) [Pandoraea oxalativorans]|uniref:Uncharacterized protein n=1 Tax=Pandoraea oxalativorans TaxID=573737 RepID=A0A0G3IIM8_9BURK|nr:hypothetical protein MB84_29760 [Pandoraea oxalativorans]